MTHFFHFQKFCENADQLLRLSYRSHAVSVDYFEVVHQSRDFAAMTLIFRIVSLQGHMAHAEIFLPFEEQNYQTPSIELRE